MKRIIISSILLYVFFSAFSQSTIYLCYYYPSSGVNLPVPVKINNNEVFSICRKTKIKCTLNSDGRHIISFNFPFVNNFIDPPITYIWADEIQLTLFENSVHYIKIKPKGLNLIQFEELSLKDGEKEFSKKKYESMSDYFESSLDSSSKNKGKKPKGSSKNYIESEKVFKK